MARLSAENHKSDPETPKPERRSNRFREIFKHRPSMSASSPVTKSSPPVTSPVASPTMKLGFEKVGLLPGEGSSLEAAKHNLENNGGTAVSEAIQEDLESVRNRQVDQEQSLEQSYKDILSKHQNAHAEGEVDLAEGSSSPILDPATTAAVFKANFSKLPSFAFGPGGQHVFAKSARYGPKKGDDTSTGDDDDPSSHRKSFASNIFDDNDSLSQGIREYVAAKIAEALIDHERKYLNQGHKTATVPIHIKVNLDMSAAAKVTGSGEVKMVAKKMDMLAGPTKIGPLTLTDQCIAGEIQLGINALYVVLALESAFSGPKTFLLTLWRIAVVLAVYSAVLRHLDWNEDPYTDAFVAPVLYAVRKLHDTVDEMVTIMGARMAVVLLRAVQGVVKSTEVDAKGH